MIGEVLMAHKIIYALFDDGAQSVFNTFKNDHEVAVYSFGIQKKETVIHCDLSDLKGFFNLTKHLPQPDLVFASPPCETFSMASASHYRKTNKGGNLYYYSDGSPITDLIDWLSGSCNNIVAYKGDKRKYFEEISKKRKSHALLHENTEKIIKYFDVPFAIENPMASLAWHKFYQNSSELLVVPDYYDSFAFYSAYSRNLTEKPTRIRSNFQLVLKPKPRFRVRTLKQVHNSNDRSAMPHELIRSIVNQLLI